MRKIGKVLLAVAAVALAVLGADGGYALAALPLVVTMTCVDISPNVGASVSAASDYAYVTFEINDADNEVLVAADTKLPYGRLVFRVTEAQKDDFVVGTSYDMDITTT